VAQGLGDGREHMVGLMGNLVIVEPEYFESARNQAGVALLVADAMLWSTMLRTVELDDETGCVTIEVHDIRPNRLLSSELLAE
jgi:hypothetical protein